MATRPPNRPPGTLGPEDLANLDAEQRRRLLELNPELAELFAEIDKQKAPRPAGGAPRSRARAPERAPEPAPPAQDPSDQAASARATDRRPGTRPRGSSRRRSAPPRARRLASRIARETPAVPGPSATNLVLMFVGSSAAVIGLVLLLQGGPAFARLPGALSTAAAKLTDPHDPIF